MYKLSGKLKIFSLVLLVIGALGIVYGFITTPTKGEDIMELVTAKHQKDQHRFVEDSHAPFTSESATPVEADSTPPQSKVDKALHQIKARPYAAVFVAAFFFFMIALGVLVFHAIQYVSEAGWSAVLYRVFEAITSYVLPGSLIVALLVLLAGTNFYPWQNKELVSTDEILQVKSVYLNYPSFVIRLLIYLLIWNVYRYFQRKNSLEQVDANDYVPFRKNYKLSVYFVILFGLSESTMAWDWFMSMTPHWFSALYAWYIFASLFVTGIVSITLVTILLKRNGYLPFVNESHLHDLGKYMFAFSIFWTYLWFSQFMLIWYANIPEEAAYFTLLVQDYKILFFGMLIPNFVLPFLLLMNADFKYIPWMLELVGVIILLGHYAAIYLLVVPSTMGGFGSFGIPEIGSILFFLGLFIIIVGTALGKVHLHPKGNPFLKESENFQY